jgi:hypothetical protein
LDVQKFAETMFKREPQILFVAVVDSRYNVLTNDVMVRDGVSLYYPKQYVHNFVQIAPIIIVDALEKLKRGLGPISSVAVRYEKRVMLFSRYEDMIVVLGLDPSVPTPFPDSMAKLIAEVAKASE